MSNLVSFDKKGPFGLAMTLIYNAEMYNAKAIISLADLLETNFTKLNASFKSSEKNSFLKKFVRVTHLNLKRFKSSNFNNLLRLLN